MWPRKRKPEPLSLPFNGPEPEQVRPIHSRMLHQWCIDAGIYQKGDPVSRVIIDINIQDAVRVYVQRFGDTRMLKLKPPEVTPANLEWAPAETRRWWRRH